MFAGAIRDGLRSFLRWTVVEPVLHSSAELGFQQIFNNQCQNAGLRNSFYPVGAAAGYSLMYLLFRIVDEHHLDRIVEFGSGQSTLLIDRLKKPRTKHVCYEHDPEWWSWLRGQLKDTDYRLRPLVAMAGNGKSYAWYDDVEPMDFDCLLVDGPGGVERYSRVGCRDIIERNGRTDFVIVFDDAERPGEKETIAQVCNLLRKKGLDIKVNYLWGRAKQAVITTGRFRSVSYYY